MNDMSKSEEYKCLKQLVESSLCPIDDASKYAEELKKLAETIAPKSSSKKESRFFSALASENRIRILKILMVREMCVCELMVALGLKQPTISYHLGKLEREDIIKKRKEGKWTYYLIANRKIVELMMKLRSL